MFPTLNSNDLVWIDSTQTNLNQQDRVWAVSINGAAAIKRLRSLKEGRVLVISDNPAIDNYDVGRDEIMIGGRVIRFARDL
jgi:phage repressor protein C with HTH and peptisase S24 domain